jgi:hypothetical protein
MRMPILGQCADNWLQVRMEKAPDFWAGKAGGPNLAAFTAPRFQGILPAERAWSDGR